MSRYRRKNEEEIRPTTIVSHKGTRQVFFFFSSQQIHLCRHNHRQDCLDCLAKRYRQHSGVHTRLLRIARLFVRAAIAVEFHMVRERLGVVRVAEKAKPATPLRTQLVAALAPKKHPGDFGTVSLLLHGRAEHNVELGNNSEISRRDSFVPVEKCSCATYATYLSARPGLLSFPFKYFHLTRDSRHEFESIWRNAI